MSRFNTLLQREWMQHHRGWLALMLLPPLLLLVLVPFGSIEIGPGEFGPAPALSLMLVTMFAAVLAVSTRQSRRWRIVSSNRRKISTLSDNPVDASQVMQLNSHLRDIDQYRRNASNATTKMNSIGDP